MRSVGSHLSVLHLLDLLDDEVGELGAILGWDEASPANDQIIDLHEPILTKLVLIELDLHLEEVVAGRMLQVVADDVAQLQAVLQGLLGLELRVVAHAKLPEVEADVAVE